MSLAELHIHLDGSMRETTFLELYKKIYGEDSINGTAQVKRELCFQKGWGLQRCLGSFDKTLKVLQTKESLERVAFEVCEDLFLESGVTYGEIRYCPSLHRNMGLTDDEIVHSVYKGLSRAKLKYGSCNFYQIITALRDLGPMEALKMTKLACKIGIDKLVVGVDLAGNEHAFPPKDFVDAFDHAHENNLGITIHAGEGTDEESIKNIMFAVEHLHATRIGHGVAAAFSGKVRSILKEKKVGIEICPTSNLHTSAIGNIKEHPAKKFFDAGINIAPCCDNSMLSQTTTRKEYDIIAKELNFTELEMKAIAKRAYYMGFANPI